MGRITDAQAARSAAAIRKLNEGEGGAGDLRSVRALARALRMSVRIKAKEAPLAAARADLSAGFRSGTPFG